MPGHKPTRRKTALYRLEREQVRIGSLGGGEYRLLRRVQTEHFFSESPPSVTNRRRERGGRRGSDSSACQSRVEWHLLGRGRGRKGSPSSVTPSPLMLYPLPPSMYKNRSNEERARPLVYTDICAHWARVRFPEVHCLFQSSFPQGEQRAIHVGAVSPLLGEEKQSPHEEGAEFRFFFTAHRLSKT